MHKLLLLSSLFLTILSAAVIEIDIEEKTLKPLELSDSQINRIASSEGSISTVIANPYVFNVKLDDSLGQAFITLKKPLEKQEGLTVITDSGFSQDFLITSKESEPTIVYLQEPKEETKNSQNSLATIETLSNVFQGKVPQGFGKRSLLQNESIKVGPLLPFVQSIDIFEGALETLYLIHLMNPYKKPLPIEKASLESEGVNWIFSPVMQLKKGEYTTVALSKKRL